MKQNNENKTESRRDTQFCLELWPQGLRRAVKGGKIFVMIFECWRWPSGLPSAWLTKRNGSGWRTYGIGQSHDMVLERQGSVEFLKEPGYISTGILCYKARTIGIFVVSALYI